MLGGQVSKLNMLEWSYLGGGDNPSDRGKVEPGLHDQAYSKIILALVQA